MESIEQKSENNIKPIKNSSKCEKSEKEPTLFFIVPFRDRLKHFLYYVKHMKTLLEPLDPDTYKILFIHQCDQRGFNRGAMKNIGFLYLKNTYPKTYISKTIVFNDIDTLPKYLPNFITEPNVIKHFFGFTNTLGGLVSINAGDFEKVNGFPNFWGWGYEDNLLQMRITNHNMKIDRSDFSLWKETDKFLFFNDSIIRDVNRTDYMRYIRKTNEGIRSIMNLEYTTIVNDYYKKEIEAENIDSITHTFVNVSKFNTEYSENVRDRQKYDLRNGPRPFGFMRNRRGTCMIFL
jgi:hypothetical protein